MYCRINGNHPNRYHGGWGAKKKAVRFIDLVEAAYAVGITTEQLAHMGANELVVRIRTYHEAMKAANLEEWRRVRRLCLITIMSMGGKAKTDSDLWSIEGDQKTRVTHDKIKEWEDKLRQLNKIQ